MRRGIRQDRADAKGMSRWVEFPRRHSVRNPAIFRQQSLAHGKERVKKDGGDVRSRSGHDHALTLAVRLMAELNYPPCHTRMTSSRSRTASFAGDSIRAQRTLFLCGSRAPRRGRAVPSRVATRGRSGSECAGVAASANRGRGFREGVEGIQGIQGEDPSPPTLDPFAPVDSYRRRHRSGRVAPSPSAHRACLGEPDRGRSRLPRSLRFPRRLSTRQRGGSSHGARPRSIRDVFGHTASISRRRKS